MVSSFLSDMTIYSMALLMKLVCCKLEPLMHNLVVFLGCFFVGLVFQVSAPSQYHPKRLVHFAKYFNFSVHSLSNVFFSLQLLICLTNSSFKLCFCCFSVFWLLSEVFDFSFSCFPSHHFALWVRWYWFQSLVTILDLFLVCYILPAI